MGSVCLWRYLIPEASLGKYSAKSKKKICQSHSVPSLIRLCRLKTAGRNIRATSTPFAGVFFYSILAMGYGYCQYLIRACPGIHGRNFKIKAKEQG